MQQLKGSEMNMDQDQPYNHNRVHQYQKYMNNNERLIFIQKMMANGQNFVSTLNDDPHFARQMSCMAAAQQEPEVMEITDE